MGGTLLFYKFLPSDAKGVEDSVRFKTLFENFREIGPEGLP